MDGCFVSIKKPTSFVRVTDILVKYSERALLSCSQPQSVAFEENYLLEG
jgi:hypothetical protein